MVLMALKKLPRKLTALSLFFAHLFHANLLSAGCELHLDYLYWKPSAENIFLVRQDIGSLRDFGFIFGPSEGLPPVTFNYSFIDASKLDNKVVYPKTHFQSGFRLGLFNQSFCDTLSYQLTWTHFHSTDSTTFIPPSFSQDNIIFANDRGDQSNHEPNLLDRVIFVGGFPDLTFTIDQLKGKWKLHYDSIEIGLEQQLDLLECGHLAFPFYLKGVRIHQDYLVVANLTLSPPFSSETPTAKVTSNDLFQYQFDGIGPELGIMATYSIWKCFHFVSFMKLHWAYGRSCAKERESAERFDSIEPEFDGDDFHDRADTDKMCTKTSLNMGVKILWDQCFCKNIYNVNASIGWEHLYLFNQSVSSGTWFYTSMGQKSGDVTTYGLTLSISVGY